MDRRKQRFKKRTAVTKEESLTPQQRPTPQTKVQQTYQQIFLYAFRRSDDDPRSLPVQSKKQQWSSAALRDRGASERRRALCASPFQRLSAFSPHALLPMRKTAKYALLTAARAGVSECATHAESSDSTHLNNPCLRV